MDFQPINFLEKLIPFLESSPFGIENIRVVPFSQQTMNQLQFQNLNALSYGGLSPPRITYDTLGNAESQKQANFYLQFLYRFVDEIGNAEATGIIANFENWIEFENVRFQQSSPANRNPLFPFFGNDPIDYSILADGGSLIMSNLEQVPHYAVYQVNIRIRHKTIYDLEDDY